jgi:hypothetical protein
MLGLATLALLVSTATGLAIPRFFGALSPRGCTVVLLHATPVS